MNSINIHSQRGALFHEAQTGDQAVITVMFKDNRDPPVSAVQKTLQAPLVPTRSPPPSPHVCVDPRRSLILLPRQTAVRGGGAGSSMLMCH